MMGLRKTVLKGVNAGLQPFGYVVERQYPDVYLHQYDSYEQYREIQIRHNKRKLDHVWADSTTLDRVIARVTQEFGTTRPLRALCHGTRNGFEQNYIASRMPVDIIGTDISETATDFERSVQWDFHDQKDEWRGQFDFIYTNSLDQSWKPETALRTWLEQLTPSGLLFIEHTHDHSARGAQEMDPFGVSPHYMPYLLCEWFGHSISLEIIKGVKANKPIPVWLFVLKNQKP